MTAACHQQTAYVSIMHLRSINAPLRYTSTLRAVMAGVSVTRSSIKPNGRRHSWSGSAGRNRERLAGWSSGCGSAGRNRVTAVNKARNKSLSFGANSFFREISTLGLYYYKVEIPTHLFWCVIARRTLVRRGNLLRFPQSLRSFGMTGEITTLKYCYKMQSTEFVFRGKLFFLFDENHYLWVTKPILI